jgi:enolase/phosphohistidine swiveling domain-containing protein
MPSGAHRTTPRQERANLQEGWVIANHILVSFHIAFISSVLALPSALASREEVLRFIFVSPETLVSAAFTYASFHTGIALHEIGHFLKAARLHALNAAVLDDVERQLRQPFKLRVRYYVRLFLAAPFGRAPGIRREGLNYYPDAPYNLAVAAAGPAASRDAAALFLPTALGLLALGLAVDAVPVVYLGRLCLGIGVVTLLDFLLADPGKYKQYRQREREAAEAVEALPPATAWSQRAAAAKRRLLDDRMQEHVHPLLGTVSAPWQFRNCGMGGRHTEKEYPESNISMQEAMFLILGAADSQESQEMTVRLQNRLKELIEKEEGCRVMGIGLEGGLAPYMDRGMWPLPEVRLWAMMKRAIEECGYRPGEDVAIALDPAASELEIAYRDEFGVPDSVGMYLFWRDQTKTVMDRDDLLRVYTDAILEHDIPILSIEDGFSEDDHEGWHKLLESLGDRILVIGDDLVTTNDETIETAADQGLINAVLVKANQIGSLYETLLALLVTLGKGLEVVVSHRSKSPNDDMEAHFALAANALGLKAGGGSNTERLMKYQAITELMRRVETADGRVAPGEPPAATVARISACEEPTNAGIPTVGVEVELTLPETGVRLSARGATPLGTSAGTGEAVHLVDRFLEHAEDTEVLDGHPELFEPIEPGVYAFKPGVSAVQVQAKQDPGLAALFARAGRYRGKGCLNAVDHVHQHIAPHYVGVDAASLGLLELDRGLLALELSSARRRGKPGALDDAVRVMQRKQNLGMNALLSVSLAMTRAVALLRGQPLYELLREELLSIIERLAAAHDVTIEGSRFSDYLAALREVNQILESRRRPLYLELRQLTGLYEGEVPEPPTPAQVGPDTPAGAGPRPGPAHATPPEPRVVVSSPFSETEQAWIDDLNTAFHSCYVGGAGDAERKAMLRLYLATMPRIRGRVRPFQIVNHRIHRDGERLVVPYDASPGKVAVYSVTEAGSELATLARVPPGTIMTDQTVTALVEARGEPIDLDREVYQLSAEQRPDVRISRIRDMAAVLAAVNACGSRQEAMYCLRFVVARLCSSSFTGLMGAKNLQPEVAALRAQLVELLNGPFAVELRLPMRILVRNISGLVSQPKLIDELWNDTIQLAEVHVRGSAITNELRRSAHHAVGQRTLRLARAYLHYLETGDGSELPESERSNLSSADEQARQQTTPAAMVRNIVTTLEVLLGTSQIVTRLQEWREAYGDALVRCPSDRSLSEELEALVTGGIARSNRWVFYHHLRSLASKAEQGGWSAAAREPFRSRLAELGALKPDAEGFDAPAAEESARMCVETFVSRIHAEHRDDLFRSLDAAVETFEGGAFFEAHRAVSELRQEVGELLEQGAFPEQRYLLHWLDCLLEEMGYFSLRHLAAGYEDEGVQLDQCRQIIHASASNLGHDGVPSRELLDLTGMLVDPARSPSEVLDVLKGIQRDYHKLVHRVTVAYEAMGRHLGLEGDELRAMQGNFQRYMHDLNSVVHFTDLALSHMQSPGFEDAHAPPAEPSAETDPYDFVHLSHVEDVEHRVERRQSRPSLQDLYGGKGSGLIYLSYLGVPTPDGFVIPSSVPRRGLHESDGPRLRREVQAHLQILEQDLARREGAPCRFGDVERPLLLAVRGGSAFSMPGMLSTVVFVGMTDRVAEALARDDAWYAYDAYRRFLVSYADALWDLSLEEFDLVEHAKQRHGVAFKNELPAEAMKEIVEGTKDIIRQQGFGRELEEALADPELQLMQAVHSVFHSWDRERAVRYREIKGLSSTWHTAVIVQRMVSGNRSNEEIKPGMDETRISLTGVVPRTHMTEWGYRAFTGEIKFSAAGDDLVGGMTAVASSRPIAQMRELLPMLDRNLRHIDDRVRRFRGTDPELEFTVDRGVLSVLQARMAQTERHEEVSTFVEAGAPLARGMGIRGGAFRGLVAFDDDDIEAMTERAAQTEDADGVLLVLENPTPADIPMILGAGGMLAARGGSTCHAAVAINAFDEGSFAAVLSVPGLRVDPVEHEAALLDAEGRVTQAFAAGDLVSIHGQSGDVYMGTPEVREAPEPRRSGGAREARGPVGTQPTPRA